jgi:hypothetical protein
MSRSFDIIGTGIECGARRECLIRRARRMWCRVAGLKGFFVKAHDYVTTAILLINDDGRGAIEAALVKDNIYSNRVALDLTGGRSLLQPLIALPASEDACRRKVLRQQLTINCGYATIWPQHPILSS